MEIKDIKFYDNKVYLLKTCSLTSEKFKNIVKEFKYEDLYAKYKAYKDEKRVEKTKFPAINVAFYKHIFENDTVPSPERMLELYFDLYSDRVKVVEDKVIFNNDEYSLNALKARILRTYPSLIRDFHFYLMVKEANVFDKVTYSCADDINGTDVAITHQEVKYTVSLYTKTERSLKFKQIKDKFRHQYDENEIRIKLNLSKAYDCGQIKLYTQSDVDFVKKRIINE